MGSLGQRGSVRWRDLSIQHYLHQNISNFVSKHPWTRAGQHESFSISDSDCFLIPRASGNCDREDRYRTVTGGCNNLQHPEWGSSYQQLLRLLPSAYKVLCRVWDYQMRDNVKHFLLTLTIMTGSDLVNIKILVWQVHCRPDLLSLRTQPKPYLDYSISVRTLEK